MGKIELTPGFCILWALLLLLLPPGLICAALAAAAVHELGHWLAVRAVGSRVAGITVGAGGMVMETLPLTAPQEILCALAGPAGSFLLLPLYRVLPLLSLCGLVQGCFNLLPLYPLDGGRALACILPPGWMQAVEMTALLALLVLAAGLGMGWGPVLAWGLLAVRKIPCKDHRFGVE